MCGKSPANRGSAGDSPQARAMRTAYRPQLRDIAAQIFVVETPCVPVKATSPVSRMRPVGEAKRCDGVLRDDDGGVPSALSR